MPLKTKKKRTMLKEKEKPKLNKQVSRDKKIALLTIY